MASDAGSEGEVRGRHGGPYKLQNNIGGGSQRKLYAINLATGARTPVKKGSQYTYQISPDGTRYCYYEGKHFFVTDLTTGESKNITATVPTSFVDADDDHNVQDRRRTRWAGRRTARR